MLTIQYLLLELDIGAQYRPASYDHTLKKKSKTNQAAKELLYFIEFQLHIDPMHVRHFLQTINFTDIRKLIGYN